MIFLTPWGLLGLLGILALIIIYILKPKFQDRSVSSSFIWKLSLKYKKKKMPFEWLKSSLLLILQILILLTMTAILTQPRYTLGSQSGEKIVILDTSASMLAEINGVTRLERAINEIEALALRTVTNQDKFSIILAGENASLIVNRSESIQFIRNKLSEVTTTYSTSNIDEAIILTENILKANNIAEIIYYTSDDYNDPGKVTIRNMSRSETNVAILSFKGELDQANNYIFVTEVVSYGASLNDVVLELRIDGVYKTSTIIDRLEEGITSTYVWRLNDVNKDTYTYATVTLLDIVDSFMFDNSLEFYAESQNFRIQIVDNNNLLAIDSTKEFVGRALQSLNRNYSIRQVSGLENASSEGFDLYIYSENVPETLPIDGAVWIFDPNTLPSSIGRVFNDANVSSVNPIINTNSPRYQDLMRLVSPNRITISRYKRLILNSSFDVLLTHQDNPILSVSTNDGVKTTIFSFGMSHTNLPLLFIDLPMLVRNLSDYSLIKTVESQVLDSGQTIQIQPHPASISLEIEYEGVVSSYGNEAFDFELNQIGRYNVRQVLNTGRIEEMSFYVRIPRQESNFDYQGDVILAQVNPVAPGGDEVVNDLFNLLPYLAAILLLFVAIEWGLQYREQY
jgi:Ca-activated chloride channel family protein